MDVDSFFDDLEYEHYTCEDPALKLPMAIFEAQPVNGRRVVIFHVQNESDSNILNILIAGNTWSFRGRLDALGIQGMYIAEGDKQVYYRILKDIDLSDETSKKKITDMLGPACFNNLAIRVVLDEPPKESSLVEELVTELKALPNCHFPA